MDREEFDKFMEDWRSYCDPKWNGNFVSDGAFACYEDQSVRVLFIGRESYGAGIELKRGIADADRRN